MRPLIQLVAFDWRELRARMHECVSVWRHLSAPNGCADPAQQLLLLLDCVFVPMREIHSTAGLRDIALDHPRDRGDVAIPRPLGFFGVAVLARTFHQGRNEWNDLNGRP